jgi:hypothetical protein
MVAAASNDMGTVEPVCDCIYTFLMKMVMDPSTQVAGGVFFPLFFRI